MENKTLVTQEEFEELVKSRWKGVPQDTLNRLWAAERLLFHTFGWKGDVENYKATILVDVEDAVKGVGL